MTNPNLSAELIQGAKKTVRTSGGNGRQLSAGAHRAEYLKEGSRIGSRPVLTNGQEQPGQEEAITTIGGDTTVQTPSADVAGVISHGILQIVSDPRSTISQMLQALLNAELADNDGWQLLKELTMELGDQDLEKLCIKAFQEEQEHLKNVRTWLSEVTLHEAVGEEALLEADSVNPERGRQRQTTGRKRSTRSTSTRKKARRRK